MSIPQWSISLDRSAVIAYITELPGAHAPAYSAEYVVHQVEDEHRTERWVAVLAIECRDNCRESTTAELYNAHTLIGALQACESFDEAWRYCYPQRWAAVSDMCCTADGIADTIHAALAKQRDCRSQTGPGFEPCGVCKECEAEAQPF